MLRLLADITWKDSFLCRVVVCSLNTEHIFKLNLSSDEIVQHPRSLLDTYLIGIWKRAEAWNKIHMNGFLSQQRVGRYTIAAAKCLDFIEPRSTLPFLNGHKRGARYAYCFSGSILGDVRGFPRNLQSFTQLYWAEFVIWFGHDA